MESKRFIFKRTISVILSAFVIFASFSVTANANAKRYVKSISVKKKATITIPANKKTATKLYKVTVKGKGKASKKFTVKSNKPSVASVKVAGSKIKVTAKKVGKATITVKTKGKNLKKNKLRKKLVITVKKDKMSSNESTEPTTAEIFITEPTAAEPESTESTTAETDNTEFTTAETDSTESTTAEIVITEPTATESDSTEPTSAETESTEPTSTETESSEPVSTEPPVTEPTTVDKETEQINAVTKYSYEIVPLLDPFNEYFFIVTDNPDPQSFRFWDTSSVYDIEGKSGGYKLPGDDDWTYYPNDLSIKPMTTLFADVEYENKETARVNGGYIASSSFTDGGELVLQARVKKSGYYYDDYEYKDTDIKITLPKLFDYVDYLIDTYSSGDTFFEKMDAVQNGLNSICLYSGVSVKGKLNKSTDSPYYGLSTSPHVDQNFYIQDPYYRDSSTPMLVSYIYPYRLDSIGFPSMMATIATAIEPAAKVVWSDSYHWLVDVTYNGETRSYGGAGTGGGQGINEDMVEYFYKFDGTDDDAMNRRALSDVKQMISYYGELDVPDDIPEEGKITWQDVVDAVGEGSYVRLVTINSIFGFGGIGFTFLYDKGSSFPGYFSDAWYDGRYFNSHEYFSKGVKFEDADTATIIIKDAVIKCPDDGKDYRYAGTKLSEVEKYNPETGVWSGYTRFRYDSESGNWIADIYNSLKYINEDRTAYCKIEDEDFINACTLTYDEVVAMNIDRNADIDPESFLIYDMQSPPGTRN